MSIDAIVTRIREHARTRSLRSLASEAGIHDGSLRRLGSEDWNPRLQTLRALERVVPSGSTKTDQSADSSEPADAQP